jgi:tetratricopeptide (TPR) repeat protein
MVESVAWITERKNVLSLLCYLGALLAYGRFCDWWSTAGKPARPSTEPRALKPLLYAGALLLFIAALLAKTTAVSLPVALFLLGWWKTGRIRWLADVLPSAPFFALAFGFGLATSWLEKAHVGAAGPEWAIPFSERCQLAGRALWFYPAKLVWPMNLCFIYPRWRLDSASLWQWLLPAAAIGTISVLWLLRNRIGRGPIAAAGFYLASLFPVLGFFNVFFFRYAFVCDHWAYLPSLGLIALGAAWMTQALVRARSSALAWGLVAGMLSCLAFLTWQQAGMYANVETLWTTTIHRNPRATMAYLCLGDVFLREGRSKDAEVQFRGAVEAQADSADAHSNLGSALLEQNRVSEALVQFQTALKIQPDAIHARNNLGNALLRAGRLAEALVEYERAVALAPGLESLRLNFGSALMQAGRAKEASVQFQRALEIRPESAAARSALGNSLLAQGRVEDAIAHFRRAVELEQGSAPAHNTLGVALLRKGNLVEASGQFEQALKIEPGFLPALHNLADTLLQQGRFEEAQSYYQQVLRINPGLAGAHNNLGNTLLNQGKPEAAILEFEKALQIQPDLAEAHNNLANALFRKLRPAEAIAHYQAAVAAHPRDARLSNNLAWALATCPEASVRDGPRAVAAAEQANRLSGGRNPIILNTLAAAYAEAGNFSNAVATVEQAIQLATDQGAGAQVETLRARLALYKSRSPFRDEDLMPRRN